MTEHQPADDLKQRYIDAMRAELGEFFHHLMQEAARLHLKWNEYEALFNAGPEKIANMNRAAPGFFWLAQNAFWHDIILSICRISDNGSMALSVKRLPRMTKVALRDELNALVKKLEDAAAPPATPGTATSRISSSGSYEIRRSMRPSFPSVRPS
jgi:hypothetical protein